MKLRPDVNGAYREAHHKHIWQLADYIVNPGPRLSSFSFEEFDFSERLVVRIVEGRIFERLYGPRYPFESQVY